MGTRGLLGVIIDGEEKLTYQQYDSYPDGVGADVRMFLEMALTVEGVDGLRKKARRLKVVNDDMTPTAEDVAALSRYTNTKVGAQSTQDWYCLLRETQGKLDLILESGYVRDAASFAADSLFCEWGYVVDLDAEVLEVYRGFQTRPHQRGRFKDRELPRRTAMGETYYPIALLRTWPLSQLPDVDNFVDELYALDGAQQKSED